MKLIMSRKGFDSQYGKVPSPIFPGGGMVSLPIPDKRAPRTYEEIHWASGKTMGHLLKELALKKPKPHYRAHLDPDLNPEARPRLAGWRPIFGQEGAAQGHLRNKGIAEGDIFLFFGWFRDVENTGSGFRYRAASPGFHALFGWLQVGRIFPVDSCNDREIAWAADHPHFHRPPNPGNVVYESADKLTLPGYDVLPFPGAGAFPRYSPMLRLTAPSSANRSLWLLPRWFHPEGRQSSLSYHYNSESWKRTKDGVLLEAARRGQEFVLDTAHYPEAIGWVAEILFAAFGLQTGPRNYIQSPGAGS